jgi:hypothetical protein
MPKWMTELSKPNNNAEFSQLCHDYFKLATMRVMQDIRHKYNVPKEDIASLTLAIFARFLNDSCYAVGGGIKNGLHINEILSKEQRLALLKIMTGEGLDETKRNDIDSDIQSSLGKFREFIMKE